MKRREALKNLGIGATASLVLSSWLTSCKEDDKGPEVKFGGVVGIVGAGAAGLAVANYLIEKGVKVKIFEASDRVGGRVVSVRRTDPIYQELTASDFNVELGADRYFGNDSVFGTIVRQMKVPKVEFHAAPNSAADYFIIDNEYHNLLEAQAVPGFNELVEFKNTGIKNYGGGGSVQTAAATTADLNPLLNSWLGNAYGSDASEIDAQALGDALDMIEHDQRQFMLIANPIANVITGRFERALKRVNFNSAVKNVDYSGDVITLTIVNPTDNSTTTEVVNKLVVTAPIPVLKDSTKLAFSPGLPTTKTDALSRIGMDASIRIILEFTRNNFFRKPEEGGARPAFIYGGEVAPSYFFSGSGRSDLDRTISVTINGPKAEFLRALADDKTRVEHVLAELDTVFDNKATLNVRRRFEDNSVIFALKDWKNEPYIMGGQSYPMVGGTNDDRVALAEPVDDKIFFAGEATDITGEFGTISGAIKSGTRAAEEVIAAILTENAAS